MVKKTRPVRTDRVRRKALTLKKASGGEIHRVCVKASMPSQAEDMLYERGIRMLPERTADAVIVQHLSRLPNGRRDTCGLPNIGRNKMRQHKRWFDTAADNWRSAKRNDTKQKWFKKMQEHWDKGKLRYQNLGCYCGDMVLIRSERSQEAFKRKERKKGKAKTRRQVYGYQV